MNLRFTQDEVKQLHDMLCACKERHDPDPIKAFRWGVTRTLSALIESLQGTLRPMVYHPETLRELCIYGRAVTKDSYRYSSDDGVLSLLQILAYDTALDDLPLLVCPGETLRSMGEDIVNILKDKESGNYLIDIVETIVRWRMTIGH